MKRMFFELITKIPRGLKAGVGVFLFTGIFVVHPVYAHEPVFSLGPETIYKGGMGMEAEVEYEKGGDQRKAVVAYELLYGLKEDLTLTLKLPYVLEKKEAGETSSGFGDSVLRAKYKFYKKDYPGAQNKAAVLGGIKFPAGDEDEKPRLGTGSVDYLMGITAGYESRKWYYFGTGRYWFNTGDGGREKGDVFLYDISLGVRPVKRKYREPDLVLLLELSGEYADKDKINNSKDSNSGGDTIYLGPTFLWSYRNRMVKGGIQFPLLQDLNGRQEKMDFRSTLALEVHF